MILIDSNIAIYYHGPEYATLRRRLMTLEYSASEITKLEALGYHNITPAEKVEYGVLFSNIRMHAVTSEIIDVAIQLKQQKRMSLGDAIIAATALTNNLELWTNNTKDFEHIPELKIYNPLTDITT